MTDRFDRLFVGAVAGAVLVAVVAVVVTTVLRGATGAEGAVHEPAADGSSAAAGGTTASAPPATSEAAEAVTVLRSWDDARAAAWAAGDEAALRALYLEDAEVAERDVAMLRRWTDRGLRVEQMQTQLVRVDLVRRTEHRLVAVVTDRLAGAVAVRESDGEQWALPRDRIRTQRVSFRRTAEGWLLASATAVTR